MTDQNIPSNVSPDSATALLRHFAWGPVAKVPGKYEVWGVGGNAREILVPLDPERGDFESLMNRAITSVLAEHGAEAQRVWNLLTLKIAASLDSTQWRKQTSVNAGLISWAEGEALYGAAQASLIASAKAAHHKQMHHGKRGAYIAKKFLERTLMGQTEVGSFVITAHTPSHERFHTSKRSETRAQNDFREAETVSGRAILNTLTNSLAAVRAGLDEYKAAPNIDGFFPLVQDGVSHELVRALAVLTDGGDAAVTVEQSPDANPQAPRRVEVTFDAVESTVLTTVAEKFKQAEPPRSVRVTGEVSLLDNSTSSPVHLVRLDVKRGADVRRARVRLSPEQYERAVEAHFRHQWIEVSGQLEKDGRDHWLYGAERLELVAPEDGPTSRAATIYSDGDWPDSASPL